MGFSRKKVKNTLLKNGVTLKAKRKGIGGAKRDDKRHGLLLEAIDRKGMILLESVNCPRAFDRVRVACPHHPEGREVLVKSIINATHCRRTGNARSEECRARSAAILSELWDDPVKRLPLLRNAAGHKGAEITKLYICRVLSKDNTPVLKFGRSERGTKRFGSFLVETLWERECPTEKARSIELYAHLRFSEYSAKVKLNTSGYTECYKPTLPVEELIAFIEESL